MTWNITYMAGAAALLAMAACDVEVASREGQGDLPSIPQSEQNGVLLNSFRLNSFRLNSFRLNSFRLNGDPGSDDYIEMTKMDLPGNAKVATSWITGSTLYVKTTKGAVLGGDDLEHAVLSFTVQENEVKIHREVRIKGVSQLELDEEAEDDVPDGDGKKGHHNHPHHGGGGWGGGGWGGWGGGGGGGHWGGWGDHQASDVTLYDLEIREGGKGKWAPLCVNEQGDAVAAVLLTDIWDPETGDKVTPRPSGAATFACVDAALGKCAVWGYRPWASVKGEDLADYHQACTRLVRADYCGNGVSHTVSGTAIHVLDELGIETKALDITYEVEAEWGPDGAICLNAANTRLPDQDVACELPACGADFASGGLIQSGKVGLEWQ